MSKENGKHPDRQSNDADHQGHVGDKPLRKKGGDIGASLIQ